MTKNILFSFSVLVIVLTLKVNVLSQQCELSVADINFESNNSLTFDVFIKNTGSSSFVYSNGSLAWTYDTAILNGGTATFSLVPDYSDFVAGAYPPSALITSPNILRTSSNLPGSNGVIQAGENLRLYRFRLQTSAASFASENFNISWKTSVVPHTRLFTWDSGTGLPTEVTNLQFSNLSLFFEENFDYPTGDLLTAHSWVVSSGGGTNPITVVSPGLTYIDYPSIAGNAVALNTNGEDDYYNFSPSGPSSGSVYLSFILKVTAAQTGDYFIALSPASAQTNYYDRIHLKSSGSGYVIGLSKSNEVVGGAIYGSTVLTFNTTYIIVTKYVFNTGSNTDDAMSIFIIDSAIPLTEPSTAEIDSYTNNTKTDASDLSTVTLRQGSSTAAASLIIDGIRVASTWTEIFPPSGTPNIIVNPFALSGFSYIDDEGPSTSQMYNLSGSNLTPASGDITVTSSTNYEISLNNISFTGTLTVPYTGGSLTATPIYVRLKSGLLYGQYDGEQIENSGGGAVTQYVTCNGEVISSLPLTENFEYTPGSNLTDNGWIAHSSAGLLPIQVNTTPLTYNGYINSDIGKSAILTASGIASAEDDHRQFVGVTSNSLYASFMVNVSYSSTDSVYVFHFGEGNSTTLFFGKVFVQNDGLNNIAFGVAKRNNSSVIFTPFSYSLNTTYLIVVKYTFNNGTTTDDEVKLWVNPVLNGIEPIADITQTDAGTDANNLSFIALRQHAGGPGLVFGGLRIADTWVPEAGTTTFPFSVTVSSGWNMVSVPGSNPAGMTPLNWWSDLNGTVYKFIPGSGYSGIATTVPGEGYWLKNNTTMTYNYPAIEIVAHTPIAATAGWNMLGGYEDVVDVNSLTTSTGSILYPIYQFNPGAGYATAVNLTPGKGYWVKVSQTCTITIPEALAKGSGEIVEFFKEDWGRIMITDATGSNYTLYGVKGEVDLNNYELPPLPPAGNFDIRFGSGRIAEDLNSGIQSIDMNGVEYPLTVRVEGMDIRLQDESGKTVNINLKSGEDIVISDATIQKLMVSGEVIPTVYALEQNYPNPFNPSTVIEFSLPEDVGNVKLSIYNALGEKVAELVNTALTAGKYQYQWNAQNVATGMYIYEFRTDKFVSVKKMLLLK